MTAVPADPATSPGQTNTSLEIPVDELIAELRPRFEADEHRAGEGPRVLFSSCRPGLSAMGHWISHVESLVAARLRRTHQASCSFAVDDVGLRRVTKRTAYRAFAFDRFHPASAHDVRHEDRLDADDDLASLTVDELLATERAGVPLGRVAGVSLRKTLRRSTIGPGDAKDLARWITCGRDHLRWAEAVLDDVRPDAVVTNHTTYIEHGGIWHHLCLARGIPTVTWQAAGRNTVIARRLTASEASQHVAGLSAEAWQQIVTRPDADSLASEARAHLDRRARGDDQRIPSAPKIGTAHQPEAFDPASIWPSDDARPLIGVFTHLPWDAAGGHYNDLFSDLRAWVAATARAAALNDRARWVFRIHPAESVRGTEEHFGDVARAEAGRAAHVHIVESETPISSYAIARHLSAAVTVRGTLAIELGARGLPVVCAGSSAPRIAEFNLFPDSADAYLDLLGQIESVPPLDAPAQRRAELYAWWHFIASRLELRCIDRFDDITALRSLTPEAVETDAALGRVAEMLLG
ncbi:MAG: hypothetical protein AAGI30_03095 [Planctomycetota bacterium]